MWMSSISEEKSKVSGNSILVFSDSKDIIFYFIGSVSCNTGKISRSSCKKDADFPIPLQYKRPTRLLILQTFLLLNIFDYKDNNNKTVIIIKII